MNEPALPAWRRPALRRPRWSAAGWCALVMAAASIARAEDAPLVPRPPSELTSLCAGAASCGASEPRARKSPARQPREDADSAMTTAESASPAGTPWQATRAFTVDADAPVFENGEVPSAAAGIERMKRYVAQCLVASASSEPLPPVLRPPTGARTTARRASPSARAERTGRGAGRATRARVVAEPLREPPAMARFPAAIAVSFLVRGPGRAEGVAVTHSPMMSEQLVRCVTEGLSGRTVGTPSADPVAVSVTFRPRAPQKQ